MELLTRLSPMTSYYIRKLYEKREKTSLALLNNIDVDVSEISGFDINNLLSKIYRDQVVYAQQLSQLESLTYLHQELGKSHFKPQGQIEQIEANIFAILEPSATQPSSASTDLPVPPLTSLAVCPTPQEMLSVLEQVLGVAVKYLGPTIAMSYLVSTQQDGEWLQQFEIRSSTQIQYLGATSAAVTPSQQQAFKDWVRRFIQHCAQVLPHFPQLVNTAVTSQAKAMLGNVSGDC